MMTQSPNQAPVVGENISRIFEQVGEKQRETDRFLGEFTFLRGDQVVELQGTDFGGILGAGKRPGFAVASSRAVIGGAPGTICTEQVVVTGTVILRDMTFHCNGNIPAVVIKSNGRCVLSNCHFFKADTQTSIDHYISVENGGLLNVVGCMFHGVQTVGFVVSNPAPAPITNADVTGCVNLTGVAHNNATVVGEVP